MLLWSGCLFGLSHCIQRHFCLLQLIAPLGHQKWVERDQTNAHLQMSLPLPGYQLSTREDIEPLLFLPRRDMSLCARLREVARHESVNEFEAFEQTIGRGIFDKRIKTRRDKQRDGEKEEENPIKSLSAGSQSRPGVTKKKNTHVVSAGCTSPRRSLQSTSCSPPTSNMIAVHCAASVQEC